MCGIAGIISLNGREVENGRNRVKKMLDSMSHRGPDGSGIYEAKDKKVILGNNRLAITDPKLKINGPFLSRDKKLVLSYNGEIYDYKEQKKILQNKGITFDTNTDTEVLLNGFRLDGLDYLKKIDGCWSFSLYDSSKNSLLITRDLLGEKQLFYFVSENEFIFSSESFSLLSVAPSNLKLDIKEIINAFRFHSSSPGSSIVSNLKRLKAGHAIFFDLNGKTSYKEKKILELNPFKWKEFFLENPSDNKVIEKISELMFISVKNRLAQDVPFVTTLSGGIDSTLIAYFSSQARKNIDTLFAQTSKSLKEYPGELNEKEASRYTSKLLNTNHKEIFVKPNKTVDLLKKNAVNSTDGLLDWGTVSFQLLGEKVKSENYKVLLVAEGADELCGYGADMNNFLVSKKQLEYPVFSKIMTVLNYNLLFRKVFRRSSFLRGIVNEPYCNQSKFIFKPHHEAIGYDFLSRFFDKKYTRLSHDAYGTLYGNDLEGLDYSQKVSLAYMQKSICDYSNLRLDKGLMSSSVEPRAPFLNLDLVNFFLSMPNYYRYRDGYAKFILRKIVEKYVGPKIAWRNKHGFSYPIWRIPEIRNELSIDKNILDSNILNYMPFAKNGKKYLLNKNYSKLAWPLFAISKIQQKYNFKFDNY